MLPSDILPSLLIFPFFVELKKYFLADNFSSLIFQNCLCTRKDKHLFALVTVKF